MTQSIPILPVEMVCERFEGEWPRLWTLTGLDVSHGLWKHPRLWRLFISVLSGVREWREHCVLARSCEGALARLQADLRAEEEYWTYRLVRVYRVVPPLTRGERREIEYANARLARERQLARNEA